MAHHQNFQKCALSSLPNQRANVPSGSAGVLPSRDAARAFTACDACGDRSNIAFSAATPRTFSEKRRTRSNAIIAPIECPATKTGASRAPATTSVYAVSDGVDPRPGLSPWPGLSGAIMKNSCGPHQNKVLFSITDFTYTFTTDT